MMKKIVYILCFLLCFSCANDKSNAEQMSAKENVLQTEESIVNKADLSDTSTKLKVGLADFSLDEINTEIQEKLQANYEATILATKHPEFAAAIKEQLADSDKFNFSLSDSIQRIEIKDLEYIGSMESRNDDISTQKIIYTLLINSKYLQKDSVLAIVKRNIIEIDNAVKVNTSFSFEKLD